MKKIVLPFEGTVYRPELLEFISTINQRNRVFLTATFVPAVDYAQLSAPVSGLNSDLYEAEAADEDKVIARHSAQLRHFCETHDISFRIHEDRYDFALSAIHKETRFADLLMLSSQHFFESICAKQPNAYMNEILHGTECPVMLLPDEPNLPGEIVLAYDGSAASVHALRQFAYLFPEFARIPTTLVFVDTAGKGEIPDEELICEIGNTHFRNFRTLRLRMSTDSFYDTWIGMTKNPWLVTGAFGRSDWSRLFAHSFIRRLIQEHRVPLFLAHR